VLTFASHVLLAHTRQLVVHHAFHVKMVTTPLPSPLHAQHALQGTIQPKGPYAFNARPGVTLLVQVTEVALHALTDHSHLLAHHLAPHVLPDSLSCRSVYHRDLHRVV
jgi:hypothetical protein